MTTFKDILYIRGHKRRFRGKGENNLKKIAKLIPDLKAWETRANIIRQGLLKGMNLDPYPQKTPLNPVIHSLRTYEDYQVENFYMESIPGFYITGSIYQPLEKNGSLPVLLKPHGHLKNKRYTPDNQNVCATFARMGMKVITYDMVGYADSTQVEHKIKSACTLQTWNSIRVLDYVLSLPDVDATRVGVTGGSGGGTQTFLLTAIDNRITACAPVVMVSSFFFGGCVCESGLPIHKGEGYATNNAEIAAMASPRPQMIVSVGGDWTRLVPEYEYPFIQRIYNFYQASDKVENAHFQEEVHNYGPSKRQAVYEFFTRNFKLNTDHLKTTDGKIDESKNVIEDIAQLQVFNTKHPRPANALPNEEAILQKLKQLQK